MGITFFPIWILGIYKFSKCPKAIEIGMCFSCSSVWYIIRIFPTSYAKVMAILLFVHELLENLLVAYRAGAPLVFEIAVAYQAGTPPICWPHFYNFGQIYRWRTNIPVRHWYSRYQWRTSYGYATNISTLHPHKYEWRTGHVVRHWYVRYQWRTRIGYATNMFPGTWQQISVA